MYFKKIISSVALCLALNASNGQSYTIIPQISDNPWSTEISADNKWLASGQGNGSIIVTDIKSGTMVNCLYGHTDAVLSLAVSSDSKRLLSGSGNGDKSILLWNMENGEQINRYTGVHTSNVADLAFVEGTNLFVSAGAEGYLVLWDIETGKSKIVFDGGFPAEQWEKLMGITNTYSHKTPLLKVVYCAQNNSIVSLTQDDISIWNINTGKRFANYVATEKLTTMSAVPGKTQICAATVNGNLLFLDTQSGKLQQRVKYSSHAIKWVSFNEQTNDACIVDESKTLIIKDQVTKQNKLSLNPFLDQSICVSKNLQYATNGLYMTSPLEIWDLSNSFLINKNQKELVDKVTSFTVNAAGTHMVSVQSMKNQIKIWDLQSQSLAGTLDTKKSMVFDVFPSSNPDNYFITDHYLKIYLYSIKSNIIKRTYFGHSNKINDFCEYNNGLNAVSCSKDKTVCIWDLKKTTPIAVLEKHSKAVNAIAVSADNKYLFSGGEDKNLIVWDLSAHTYIKKLFGHSSGITDLVVSPNNKYIVSCGADKRIILWEMGTWKVIKEFTLQGSCASMCFSADGLLLYFCINDFNKIYALNINTLSVNEKYTNNSGNLKSLLINNENLYSLDENGCIKTWNTNTNNWLAHLSGSNNCWAIYNQNNFWDGASSADGMFTATAGTNILPVQRVALSTNRPDILLNETSVKNSQLTTAFSNQYKRRLLKAGLTEVNVNAKVNLPVLELLGQNNNNGNLQLVFNCTDNTEGLLSYQVLVNGIPQFGQNGKPLIGVSQIVTESIELPEGDNFIELFCLNKSGYQSYSEFTHAKGQKANQQNLYIISIGVSKYQNAKYNLQYADKDANDFAHSIESLKGIQFNNIYTKVLTNEQVTPVSVKACKSFLGNVKINDMVIVFMAGHGKFDFKTSNYYYLTYGANLSDLKNTAINYNVIEGLLTDIPNRHKIIFIDACESGEQVQSDNNLLAVLDASGVNSRGFKVVKSPTQTVIPNQENNINRNRYIFNDIFIRNGAIVFSSSAANELSYESNVIGNGFFTHALIRGLKGEADANTDGTISILELKVFVANLVGELSNNLQNPTIDRDNRYQNFSVKVF